MTFRPNSKFIDELKEQAGVQDARVEAAGAVRDNAADEAHRIMPRSRSEQIEVVEDGDEVLVANQNHGAWIDEIGSVNSAPYAPLRRGVTAAGLRLDEHG